MFHTLFWVGAAIQMVGVTTVGVLQHWGADAFVLACFTLLPMAKLNIIFGMHTGWAVDKMSGKRRPGGLPIWMWGLILLFLCLSLGLMWLGWASPAGDRSITLGAAMAFGTLWSILIWFLYWKERNRFKSAYEVHVLLRELGYSEKDIEAKIAALKRRGMIALDDQSDDEIE